MTLDESMNAFRLASRELFNGYFRVADPYENGGWLLEERFSAVEMVLFDQLVSVPHALPEAPYGKHQKTIVVGLKHSDSAPIMVNRSQDSGYWDHPLVHVPKEAKLTFLRFFDWDQVGIKDHQYVQVLIDHWPEHPEISNFQPLIEAQYVVYRSA
jgi:hypothetical protein